MIKINVAQICEVRILDLRTNPQYEWRPGKNSFWNKQVEGFYDLSTPGSGGLMTVEEIERIEGLVCMYKRVCWKPRIYMQISDGSVIYKYFDTIEDAKEYFDTAPEFSEGVWLNVD